MLGLGAGLLPLLRLARTPQQLLARLPLAYAVGLATTGVLGAELAVVGLPVGWIALLLVTVAALALGRRRLELTPWEPGPALRRQLPSYAMLTVVVAFLASAAGLFAVKPLFETDGWMLWGMRARALYDFGHPVAPVFTSAQYPGLPYPLWLPALEAADFRFMGGFDGTLVHLQLAGVAVAFFGGAWVLLRRFARPFLLAAALLAIVTAPSVLNQLQTNFADVPLAMLISLGAAALAVWMRTGEPGLLPAAALFLGAGTLTKNEGGLFVVAAFGAAAIVARRKQLRPLALAAAAVAAIYLPWGVWVALHHVKARNYTLSNLLRPSYLSAHSDRVGPVVRELLIQIRATPTWSHLLLFAVVGLIGAFALRRVRLAAFAVAWLLFSFAGLVAIYWISPEPLANHLYNSSDRTIDTLVIGAALLVPVLLHAEPERDETGGD
jgi:dolichyl-phosphate-mannose-protein mannosyltransferase